MKLKTKELVFLLEDIKQRVEKGDSFEGTISYTCMEEECGQDEWVVVGSYRIGNTQGQGGYRILNS